jgi:hypothetical protein
MLPRIKIAIGPRGPKSPEGDNIHRKPQLNPHRHDLRKVKVPADDPDLGNKAREEFREENPGFELPGTPAKPISRRNSLLPRIFIKD